MKELNITFISGDSRRPVWYIDIGAFIKKTHFQSGECGETFTLRYISGKKYIFKSKYYEFDKIEILG